MSRVSFLAAMKMVLFDHLTQEAVELNDKKDNFIQETQIHTDAITGMYEMPSGEILSSGIDNSIKLTQISNLGITETLEGIFDYKYNENCSELCYNSSSNIIAVGGADGIIKVFQLK